MKKKQPKAKRDSPSQPLKADRPAELETSKEEEPESANEELITLNEEMANRNAELTRLNADWLNLINSINLPVVVLGHDLTIRWLSAQAETLLGFRGNVVNRPIGSIWHNLMWTRPSGEQQEDRKPEVREDEGHAPEAGVVQFDMESIVADVIATVRAREFEVRGPGDQRHLVRVRPYITLDNKVDGAVLIAIEDVTVRQRTEDQRDFTTELEAKILDRTNELVQSQERLRAMAMELTLTEQRERKRLAIELHDSLVQLLALGKIKVDQIKQQTGGSLVGELDEILDQALTYTRTLVAQLSPPYFHDLGLPYAFKWLAEQLEPRGFRLTVEMEDGFPSVADDHATLLFQSARELLMNVLKHAGTDHARLAMTTADGTVRITVSDDGSGFAVAAATAPAAADEQTSHVPGFGLFSIRERMLALGGRLELVSRPGQGTRATLIVPLPLTSSAESGEVQRSGHPSHAVLSTQSSGLSSTRIRVLLVDDHAMVRQGLRTVLESYPDIEVVGEAADGEAAVSAADHLRPSVVVMDINMPRMNGIEATAQIKARHPGVVVIGLSVQADAHSRSALLGAGAVALVTKEAAAEELYRTIRQFLESRPS